MVLDGGKKATQEIMDDLQSAFSLSSTTADEYLRQSEQLFESIEIPGGTQKSPETKNHKAPEDQNPHQYEDRDFFTERRYKVLSSSLAIRFTDSEQVSLIDQVLGHLRNKTQISRLSLLILLRTEYPALNSTVTGYGNSFVARQHNLPRW